MCSALESVYFLSEKRLPAEVPSSKPGQNKMRSDRSMCLQMHSVKCEMNVKLCGKTYRGMQIFNNTPSGRDPCCSLLFHVLMLKPSDCMEFRRF